MQKLNCGGSGIALAPKYAVLHSQQKAVCTCSTRGRPVRMHLCRNSIPKVPKIQYFINDDTWAHQLPEHKSPGYTRTSVLGRVQGGEPDTRSRRIDCIFVSGGLPEYASSVFTTRVGFTDHNPVVLHFIPMGLDGTSLSAGSSLDALRHEDTVTGLHMQNKTLHRPYDFLVRTHSPTPKRPTPARVGEGKKPAADCGCVEIW